MDAARSAFAQQAVWAERLGSPFMARLCEVLGERLDRGSAVGRRVLDWPADTATSLADAVPLRLTGVLHALVRSGAAPALASLYPPNALPDPEALWAAVAPCLIEHEAEILDWLKSPPQTNEVGRSAAIMSGLLVIAERWPMPMALYELGASGGLNLFPDKYAYRLGGLAAGEPASPVRLAPQWEGASPPSATVRIASRQGVDLNPLDVTSAKDRRRLVAYIWPDQRQRLDQLAGALEIAAAEPPSLSRADAADWLETVLTPAPQSGRVRVVTHTIAFQYFAEPVKQRIVAHLRLVGASATNESPLAWLGYEIDRITNTPTLSLATWPGGRDQVLATGHPHGRTLKWLSAIP